MQYVNSHGIPDTIRTALIRRNEAYSAGKVDTSVTQLIQPPQITVLRKKHYKEMVKEAYEDFWALLGSGVHAILEWGGADNMILEERLFLEIDGWKISGGIDVQEFFGDDVIIHDYKTTSTYAIMDGHKEEWETQLNLYALLVEANKKVRVTKLRIVAILRDWSGAQAKRDAMYPQTPIVVLDIPLWSFDERVAYARGRIAAHREARFADRMGDDLPECSDQERWVKESSWAVMKEGNKKASKVFDNEAEAVALITEKGKGYSVEYRPGASTRCQYCGCNPWCGQYAAMAQKDNPDGTDPIPEQQTP